MSVSGWHTVTDNLEKTWVFDHAPGTPQMRSVYLLSTLLLALSLQRNNLLYSCDAQAMFNSCRVLPEIVTELRKALDEINRKDKASYTSLHSLGVLQGTVAASFIILHNCCH